MGETPNPDQGIPAATEPSPVYNAKYGTMWCGDSLRLLSRIDDASVHLILTSPPFALTRQKEYGNHPEDEYISWFEDFAEQFHRVLADDGSLVIDLGGAWLPGAPTRSLYQYRLLLMMVDKFEFHLAEDFYWFNRAKLPGPRQWVTMDRVRAKDAVNTLWWLSKTENPRADNRKVLRPYSPAMQRLLKRGTYNAGDRPSQHSIGKNWARDLGGAIPPNVIETFYEDVDNLLDVSNTASNEPYHLFCRRNELKRHPARFPREVPEFFIKFLATHEDDIVLDPFGGSNVTGAAAEKLARPWITCEIDIDYIAGSLGRFEPKNLELTLEGIDLGLDPKTLEE